MNSGYGSGSEKILPQSFAYLSLMRCPGHSNSCEILNSTVMWKYKHLVSNSDLEVRGSLDVGVEAVQMLRIGEEMGEGRAQKTLL